MECMEVWGGNHAIDRGFQTAGLTIWIYSRPFGQAEGGGDVYYLSSCASGRITRMLLADVSGHGQSVAQFAAQLRDLMRRNVAQVLIAAAMANEVLGWVLLGIAAGLAQSGAVEVGPVLGTLAGHALFLAFALTVGQGLPATAKHKQGALLLKLIPDKGAKEPKRRRAA